MRKFNLKPKAYSHIVSGLMACSTILSVMLPSANALADNTNNNSQKSDHVKNVNLNTPANDKASLDQMAGLSSNQQDLDSQKNTESDNSQNQNSKQNKDNHLQIQKSKQAKQTTRTQAHFNQLAVKRSQNNASQKTTAQVTVTYTYNGTSVGEKTVSVPVGKTVNLANQLPSELQTDYQLKPGFVQHFKATVPTQTTATVSVSQNTNKNSQKLTNKTPLNHEDSTPLPSMHSMQSRSSVVNPMLRPDNAPHYSSASQFKSEVPMTTKDSPRDLNNVKPFGDFTKSVLQYKPYMDKVCNHYQMSHYEMLMLAIMQVESGGHGSDVMQSSESLGLSAGSLNPQQSIEQGVRYMAKIVHQAKQMDKAEHQDKKFNPKDYHYYANDNRLLAQSYNYGGNFLDYVAKSNTGYTLGLSEKYSRDVVAPRLGNSDGSTYTYDNPVSRMYHRDYLYTNGGNFYYGDLVERYATNGYLRPVLSHLISNHDNLHGDTNLISKGLNVVHDRMPNNLNSQKRKTNKVKSGLKSAQAGDLVFFHTKKDPSSSRVGFVMDPHTMFSANQHGAGFHSLDTHYMKSHIADIRRLPNANKLNAKANAHLEDEANEAGSVNSATAGYDSIGATTGSIQHGDTHTSSGTHYQPSAVPANLKKYIHDPRDVGMDYGSSEGWDDKSSVSADQCVGFSCSFFPAIWHTSIRNTQGNGIDQVHNWSHLMNGKVSNTPQAGAIASSSNPALTGGNAAGHTFIVEHVFPDGSILEVGQNWPGLSGSDNGMTNTWDYAILPASIVDNGTTFFMPNTHQYHLNWK